MGFVITISVLALVMFVGGLSVYIRNPRNPVNIIYFAMTTLSAVWACVYGFSEIPDTVNAVQIMTQISYFLSLSLSLVAALFSFYFPRRIPLKRFLIVLIMASPVLLASFTTFISGEVTLGDDGVSYEFSYGLGTVIFALALLLSMSLLVYQLYVGYKNAQTQIHKTQIQYLILGFVLSYVAALFLTLILPVISPDNVFDDFAPFSLIFFIFFTGRAIVQRRLFDFRTVLAKVFAYGLTFTFITILYVAMTALIRSTLSSLEVDSSQIVFRAIPTLVIVLFYPKIQQFFYRLSNRFLFKDLYDPQTLISKLNQTLVADVDLESILEKTSKIIEEQLKASYCGFYIRETSYFPSRFIGDYNKKIPEGDLEKIRQVTPLIRYKVHSVDVEPDGNEEKILNDLLKTNDIEVLGRLVSTINYDVAGVGYMLLGPRRTGEVYSEQDLKLLEIIANELVLAIENALKLEEIEQFNVTLQKKIDGATKELKDNNEKLKALDIAKDEFVSMASHQLRTPLTSIKGYISMVLEGDAGKINDQQKKMLGQAFFSSQRMVYLISDLLNISRLRTGKFIIESKPTDLADLIQSELKQLEEGAAAKNLTMTYKKPKSFPIMNLDDMKIRQVVMNFVDNALYYTPQNGEITIELKEKPRSVEFTVKDSGIGVPKKEQHKLFTKFYRADNARKARPDGTGIGLFMAKKIIATSGGSIIFHSKEGKGSTFGFSFPKKGMVVTGGKK